MYLCHWSHQPGWFLRSALEESGWWRCERSSAEMTSPRYETGWWCWCWAASLSTTSSCSCKHTQNIDKDVLKMMACIKIFCTNSWFLRTCRQQSTKFMPRCRMFWTLCCCHGWHDASMSHRPGNITVEWQTWMGEVQIFFARKSETVTTTKGSHFSVLPLLL